MHILSADFAMEWLRPMPPNAKLVGPLLPEPPKPLPSDIEVSHIRSLKMFPAFENTVMVPFCELSPRCHGRCSKVPKLPSMPCRLFAYRAVETSVGTITAA